MPYSLHALEPFHHEPAAMALALAFIEDPLFALVAPDPDQRRAWLPIVMQESIRAMTRDSRSRVVISDSGQVVAAMIAGGYPPSLLAQLRQQLISLLFPRPWVPRLRPLLRVFRYLNDWEQRHPKLPHHYVNLLGGVPDHQHRGLGRMMMSALLAEGDAENIPVYLETVTEPNVRFYQSLGFRIMDTCQSHPDGPHAWMMFRDARPAGAE